MWACSLFSSLTPAISTVIPLLKSIALNAPANGSSTSGTGASCIYPLLACQQRPNWKLIGTEIDDKSLSYAQRNVKTNGLESQIKILKSDLDGPLIPAQLLENVDRYAS
jgi:23S rRNA A1618 N6-methylase RlmF